MIYTQTEYLVTVEFDWPEDLNQRGRLYDRLTDWCRDVQVMDLEGDPEDGSGSVCGYASRFDFAETLQREAGEIIASHGGTVTC